MSTQADNALTKGSSTKSKRSFMSRLPSFRKKKPHPVLESELDMHLRSAKEDLKGGVKTRPPTQAKNRKDDIKKRSKTSSIVASYEKRLSDLKDEEIKTNVKQSNGKTGQHDGVLGTNKSRFGFGFTQQKITSYESDTTDGKNANPRNRHDEFNANVQQEGNTGSSIKPSGLDLQLPRGSPPDRESSSSVRTPESDRSSVSSNSSAKVYGQPMPYRSVFGDEPRGIKRQASGSQSDGLNSSGISLSRSTSPLYNSSASTTHNNSDSHLQLNSTFSKDSRSGSAKFDFLNRTFPIGESTTCIVNRTFRLEPAEHCGTDDQTTGINVKQELANEIAGPCRAEHPISCRSAEPSTSTMTRPNCPDASHKPVTQTKAFDDVMPPEQDVHASRPLTSPPRTIPTEISPVHTCLKNSYLNSLTSPRHRRTNPPTMGNTQSAVDCYSTPAHPIELAFQLRKPQISAVKNYSESVDSCELDSLCSEDLMCDSRFLDDDTFDARDDSESLLGRSLSVDETSGMYRGQHSCSAVARNRSVSMGQTQILNSTCSLEKRVGVTRGLSPSPLAMPPGRRGSRIFYPAHPVPDEMCQSPVEELQSLINSSCYGDADRNKNDNTNCSRNRSQSGPGTSHALRPPRWPTLAPDEDGTIVLDMAVYRHMIQDMTSVKTMLFKLKRVLQAVDSSSNPFENSSAFASPCSSQPTSPVTEANPIHEVIIEDIREENSVLRKEVRNLQELLVDTQHQMKDLQIQSRKGMPEQQHVSTQFTSQTQATSPTRDQSFQVNLPTTSFPSKAPPTSSPTRRKCRAEVSKIKAAYEEYIRLHNVKGGERPEKLPHVSSQEGSPLKVGRSPTSSSPERILQSSSTETTPPESKRNFQNGGTTNKPEIDTTLETSVPTSMTKDSSVRDAPPVFFQDLENLSGGQASQSAPSSPNLNQVHSPKSSGARRPRSKLAQPVSYVSKLAGSQDSLASEGSQIDDGTPSTEERRGSPLKRQLGARPTGIPQRSSSVGKQSLLEVQQKSMQEVNGSAEGIPKPKEIRMMPGRQLYGKILGLPQRAQNQNDTSPQSELKESSGLPPKMPSMFPVLKTSVVGSQDLAASPRGAADRQPTLTDTNSNPVPQQNGIPAAMKASGLPQPQFVRRADLTTISPTSAKVGQLSRRKQSPPNLAHRAPSQSPDRYSVSSDEQVTPPASPRGREQQRQQRDIRIAMPVRGRGASKLPRGSGIPTRRTNNS